MVDTRCKTITVVHGLKERTLTNYSVCNAFFQHGEIVKFSKSTELGF